MARRGTLTNPCKTRSEAIRLAMQDARCAGPYNAHHIHAAEYRFFGIPILPEITTKVYYSHASYPAVDPAEPLIHLVAIEDHFIGHLFDDFRFEPPHIHATKINSVTENGSVVVSEHRRMDGCLEHYYYVPRENCNDLRVVDDENYEEEREKNKKRTNFAITRYLLKKVDKIRNDHADKVRNAQGVRQKVLQVKLSIQSLRTELAKSLHSCKIAKTTGNATAIAGTIMLFTPLALFGVAALVAGSATAVGTTVTEYFITKDSCDALLRELEVMNASVLAFWAQISNELLSVTLKAGAAASAVSAVTVSASSASQVLRIAEAIPAFEKIARTSISSVSTAASLSGSFAGGAVAATEGGVAVGEAVAGGGVAAGEAIVGAAEGGAVVGKVGISTLGKSLAAVGVVLNVADIVYTWAHDDATLASMDDIISKLDEQLSSWDTLIAELVLVILKLGFDASGTDLLPKAVCYSKDYADELEM